MATLIQSKQIQGVVTASVIEGDFSVSGSLVVTGSQTILGSVTASSISSSFIGDGSGLTGISYSQVLSTPQFVGGNNITIASSSNVITIDASLNGAVSSSTQITDGSGILSSSNETFPQFSSSADVRLINLETYSSSLDSRFLNTDGDNVVSASSQITISDTIGYTAFSSSLDLRIDVEKSRVDAILDSVDADKDSFAEIVTLINQVDTTNDVAFAAHYTSSRQRDTSLELFSSSIQSEVDSLTSATSSYLTEIPQGTISGSEQLPSGLVSSSNQVLGGTGILSGSYTDITDLNTFTQSVDTRVTSLESFSSSLDNTFATDAELTSLSSSVSSNKSDINSLGNTNNTQNTRLDNLELFTSSLDSTYATDSELSLLSSSIDSKIESLSHSDNTELNTFTSSIQSEVDALIAATASYLTSETDSQTLTVSGDQLTISSGNTVTIPTGSNTDISELNTFTSSIQSEVDILSSATSSYLTELPSGLVSGSVVEELPSGVISGSTQITITESQISDLTHYTDSDVKTKLDTESVLSGSSQVTISDTDGFTSFSSSIDTSISTEKARIDAILLSSDADKDSFAEIVTLINQVDTDNDNAFAAHYTASNARIDSLEGFTSSIDTTIKTKLDTEGIVSGSTQVLGGSGIVSSSTQIESLLPDGTISGSTQVVSHLPSGTISGSTQVLGDSGILSSSVNFETYSSSIDSRVDTLETTFSSSVSDNLIILNDLSASHVVESSSLDDRLDRLEGGAALYYDLSNTVWNNKFIEGGSSEYRDVVGGTPVGDFRFTLNTSNKLTYDINDVVYITNFDRDTVIHALVTSSYDENTRQVTFSVLDVNGITGSVKINDPYWIITKQSSGFVQLNDYISDSASLDSRLDEIEGPISSSFDLRILESYVTASDHEGRIDTLESTFATDVDLRSISSSIDTRIDDVYLSQSIALSGVVSGSSQIDFREITNYVSDEHIDHTTVNVIAGDGLDGGGDIASSHEIRLNVTSSHFTSGVGNVLTSEGVVKQSTLDTDIIGTDFSQSVDTRIRSFAASSVPTGTVSGSTQVDITQTENYTEFSSSIATSIAGVSGGESTDISHLNTFSSSIQSTVDSLVDVTASLATTGSNIFVGNQYFSGSLIPESSITDDGIHSLGSVSNPWKELYISTASLNFVNDEGVVKKLSLSDLVTLENYPHEYDGMISSSAQITALGFISESVGGTSDFTQLTNVPSGLVSSSDQVLGGSDVVSGSVLRTLGGTGVLSGSHTDISHLNTFTSSVQTEIDGLSSVTSSYLTELPSGLVSGSSQLTSSLDTRYALSGSGGVGGDVTFDGNRVISNEDLGDLFSNSVNPGTDGTIQDFLNAVFYPNSAPSITTGNQTIQEYTTNGSTIVTLVGTDPEGQTLTWGTADSYTDGLVSVASNGVMTLSSLPTSASFNTSAVGGGFGHLVTVKVTDTFNTTTEKDIYIIVTPNEAPKFRETSVAGTIINSVNVNLNENSVNNTLVKRIFFTDAESDTITITTSSIDNEHFDVDIQSTYVDIRQNTGSLDYEQKTSYTFNIFAADEHYQAGDDLDSITTLPITINVVDNLVPTINDQTLSSINENSSNGASVDSISAADNEGDTITFSNFTLSRLELDGVEVTQGTYGGTSQLTDPHENPFQMDSSGNVTRKSGVYLNSDLIDEYQYTVVVKDGFNTTSSPATITIPITDDTPATLTDNWSAGPYIIESAVTGNTIKISSNGRTGTQADYNSNQSGTWSSSNSVVSINSNGNLSLGSDVSGIYVSGNTITSTITFTNTFGTTTTDSLSISVAANDAPTATFSNTSFNNTNQATGSANMVSVTISDTEGDTPYGLTLSGTNASSLNAVPQNADSSSWELQVASDLSAGTYTYDVTVTDNFGKSTSYNGRTLTINQASNGTMVENGTFYVIESAQSGPIYINSNGRSGSSGVTTVSYSTNYGSQVAKDFTSSNSLIGINSVTGVLSVGSPISGSGNTNGSVIASTITWVDQYGNNGSDTIAVNVTKNNAPTVSSTQTFNTNTNQATGSSEIVRLNLTDTEGDSILASGLSWSGYDSTYFTPSNSTGVMRLLVNSTSIPAGVYGYTASIEDVHGFDTTLHSSSVTIAQADNGTLGGDTSIYIIESALQNSVFRDASGYNNGNAAQVSVSYSASYGSPVVTEFTSSRQGISVDSSGNLTAGYDFSGSVTSTDYTSTTLTSDSTNSTLYGKSLYSHGLKIVQGAAVGGQTAVPDLFTEKVAQVVKLMITGSGPDIDAVAQANMIGTLKGESGTWHSGYPTAQRILRGAGSDYSPNPLIDSNYSSYPGLQNFQDTHSTNDMVWYLNSSATPGSGDADITEVMEHLMHTIHLYGVRGGVEGSVNGLSWITDLDSDWNTRELYLALKEAVDNSVFDISGYGDGDYTTAATFELAAKEYLYLLNFNMWEYSSLWDGGSLSPEWNDNSRTQSGIQTYNPLGYTLYNKYIKPVLTKPSLSSLRSIFQDGDVGNPAIAGSSGYTTEVGSSLISNITFIDQYGNVGSGSVTATVFGNSAPSATFTANSLNSDEAIDGADIGSVTVTDTEGNSPFTLTLGGTDGSKFRVSGVSSPFEIQPTETLSAGNYSINITVTDNYGESVTLNNETITVTEAEVLTEGYIYYSAFGSDAGFEANYLGLMGASTVNSDVPPEVTAYTANTLSPFNLFKTGDIGSTSITYAGGTTATLGGTISGSNFNDAIKSAGNMNWGTGVQTIFVIPSGSTMTGIPTSMTDATGGSTNGEYVLVEYADGTAAPLGATPSIIHSIVLDSPKDGYTEWFVLGAKQQNSASNMRLQIIPSSGSIGDFV